LQEIWHRKRRTVVVLLSDKVASTHLLQPGPRVLGFALMADFPMGNPFGDVQPMPSKDKIEVEFGPAEGLSGAGLGGIGEQNR